MARRGNPQGLTPEAAAKGRQMGNAAQSRRRMEERAFMDAFQEAAERSGVTGEELRVRLMGKLIDCAMKGQSWALLRTLDHLCGMPKQTVAIEGTLGVAPVAPTTVLTPEQARRVAEVLRDDPNRN